MLLPSTRLSNDAYEHILNVTGCNTFFYTTKYERRVSEIREFRPNTLCKEVPSVDDVVNTVGAQPYPFSKTFEDVVDEAGLIIHSSGTTGTLNKHTICELANLVSFRQECRSPSR